MTRIIKTGVVSPYAAGPSLAMSAVESAVWPLFAPWRDTKRAFFLDVSSPRFYLRGDPAGDPGGFVLIDRAGGRIMEPSPLQARHPYIVTDSITGRPVLCFGAGGSGGNVLTDSLNGVLRARSVIGAGGAETNNLPIILPGVGFSVAFKVRIPAPSTSVNGRTFGATPGGVILGGATSTVNNGLLISTRHSTGYLFVMPGNNLTPGHAPAVDMRDGAWHDFVVVYNHDTATISSWTDGVANTPTSSAQDVSSTTGASSLLVGGSMVSSGTAFDQKFTGFLAAALFLPGAALADATARANVRALLATR